MDNYEKARTKTLFATGLGTLFTYTGLYEAYRTAGDLLRHASPTVDAALSAVEFGCGGYMLYLRLGPYGKELKREIDVRAKDTAQMIVSLVRR